MSLGEKPGLVGAGSPPARGRRGRVRTAMLTVPQALGSLPLAEDNETQRGLETCLRSPTWKVAGEEVEARKGTRLTTSHPTC